MLVKGSKGVWALIAWLLCASCNPEEVAEVEPDEYEIYSVAISALYGSSAADHFVLLRETIDDPTCNFRYDQMFQRVRNELRRVIGRQAIASYCTRNKRVFHLQPRLNLKRSYSLLSAEQAEETLNGSWPGWIAVSRVGFDGSRTQGLVQIGNHCDGLCGSGHFVVLVKRDGLWRIEKEVLIAVS